MHKPLRVGLSAAVVGSLAFVAVGCGKTSETATSSSTTQIIAKSSQESVTPTTASGGTSGTSIVKDGTTTTAKKATTTTAKAKLAGPEFAVAAVDAFKQELGDVKAIELTVNFNDAGSLAKIQAQDPAKPANVDEYEYRGTEVSDPVPVKLTGDGKLEDNLFAVSEIAWDQLPQMFDTAKTSIGVAEGSKGISHFIVQKNLPFDDDTVVNVYVDGGTRGQGGYVSFKADGTVKKVYGKS